jgi:hypothetical protein
MQIAVVAHVRVQEGKSDELIAESDVVMGEALMGKGLTR